MADLRQLLDARRWTREQAESLILLLRERPTTLPLAVGSTTWTNMPAALTPLFGRPAGSGAAAIDLRGYTEVRLTVACTIAGASGASLQARLATTAPTVAGSYAAPLAACSVAAAGILDSGWQVIPISARVSPAWIDAFGIGGDAAADPVIGLMQLWLR